MTDIQQIDRDLACEYKMDSIAKWKKFENKVQPLTYVTNIVGTKWNVQIVSHYLCYNIYITGQYGTIWKSRYNVKNLDDAMDIGLRLLHDTFQEKQNRTYCSY